MINNKSSFHMGDEINGYGQEIILIADQITPQPASQDNVRLTPNFNKYLTKLIFSIPVANNLNSIEPIMSKMIGSLTALNQVIFSDTTEKESEETSLLGFQLARSNASTGSGLMTAFGNKNSSNDNKKNGWRKEDGNIVHYKNDKIEKKKFIEEDGKKYYVDSEGHVVIGLKKIGKYTYYFAPGGVMDGIMVQDEIKKIDGESYYFDEDGHMKKSTFIKYGDYTYYFNEDGHMLTGQQTIKKKNYLFSSEGKMYIGQAIVGGKQCYYDLDGVMVECYTINDFLFEETKKNAEKKKDEALAATAMYLHQQYDAYTSQTCYVPQGSVLACSEGTKLSCLDTTETADICDVATGLPIMGCDACIVGKNIYNFCGCRASDSTDMPKRIIVDGYKKCIPLLDKEWKQEGKAPLLWNSQSDKCSYALKQDSFITCRYGGWIGIVEIPEKTLSSDIYDLNGKDIGKKALEIMEKAYYDSEFVKLMVDSDGLTIFAMEGLGENSGKGIPDLFPNGRYGAELVVAKGNVVEFVTYHATTLPSALEIENYEVGIATVVEGVYSIFGKRHQGKYPAFGLKVKDDENNESYNEMPVTRKVLGERKSYKTTANGINLHTAPNDTGPLYSEGCQMIRSQDYIDFLIVTGLASKENEYVKLLRGKSIEDSLTFRGQNLYPTGKQTRDEDEDGEKYKESIYGMDDGHGNKLFYINLLSKIELIDGKKGYYVLDRTNMPQSQRTAFYI